MVRGISEVSSMVMNPASSSRDRVVHETQDLATKRPDDSRIGSGFDRSFRTPELCPPIIALDQTTKSILSWSPILVVESSSSSFFKIAKFQRHMVSLRFLAWLEPKWIWLSRLKLLPKLRWPRRQ